MNRRHDMTGLRVLVVDDDVTIRNLMREILSSQEVHVYDAGNAEDALKIVTEQAVDVQFVDIRLPTMSGIDLVQHSMWIRPKLLSIIVTGYPSFETSVESLQKGVCDYVTKPITRQKIIAGLARATQRLYQMQKNVTPKTATPSGLAPPVVHFVAESTVMRKLMTRVDKVKQNKVPLLIQGEKGVGKSLMARYIHQESQHASAPFMHVVCNAIREERLELLLDEEGNDETAFRFGGDRLLERARGGTLYLDEVVDLPRWAQVQLLHILENTHAAANLRVIASTSCDVDSAIADGQMYGDLHYYLKFGTMWLPPLRQRKDDIRPLAEYLLAQFQGRTSQVDKPLQFSQEAWQYLIDHAWPGNARELANVIERVAIMGEGGQVDVDMVADAIDKYDLTRVNAETITVPLRGDLKQIECHIVRKVIDRYGGNKAAAARSLGMHRRTIYRLLDSSSDSKQPGA